MHMSCFAYTCTLLTVALCLASCGKGTSGARFGPGYNTERKKRGIIEIPADWVLDKSNQDAERCSIWRPPVGPSAGVAGHDFKVIDFAGSTILYEQDNFSSGKVAAFTDADGRTRIIAEAVCVQYSYERERSGRPPWHIFYFEAGSPFDRELSRVEANAILLSWHLPPI